MSALAILCTGMSAHVGEVNLGVMQTGSGPSLVTRALVISLLNRIKVCRHNTLAS